MKKITNIIYPVVVALVLLAGTQAVSAWVGPSSNPPSGNVAVPINLSSVTQSKAGTLGVGGLAVFGNVVFSSGVKISNGTQGVNKVFTSDSEGNGTWQPLPASCASN